MDHITTGTITANSIGYVIKNYVDYNLWANATLINWLKRKPAALLDQEVPSSFPTIRETLIHIWQTQVYWLSVIKKEPLDAPVCFDRSKDNVLELLFDHSAEFTEYIDSIGQESIEETTLVISPWFKSDFQNFEYIMHIMNHGTYHRGQIITMGRMLGLTDAPMTDYNYYNVMGK